MPRVGSINVTASADWSVTLGALYVSAPQLVTAGNTLVVVAGALTVGQTVVAVTDSAGNTYVKVGHVMRPVDDYREEVWVASNVLGHSNNIVQVQWSSAVSYRGILVAHYEGLNAVPLDAVASGIAAPPTTTVTTDTLTTTTRSDLHLLVPRWGLLDTITWPSGFVNVSPHPRTPIAEKVVGGATPFVGTYTITHTDGVNTKLALVVALKAAIPEAEAVLDQTLDDLTVEGIATSEFTIDAVLNQILPDVTVASFMEHATTANLVQTLDDVTVVSTAFRPITATLSWMIGLPTLVAIAELGDEPTLPAGGPRIYNLTGQVRDSGGAILCFVGPPNRTIDWRLLEGHGTLTPFTTFTDKLGRCSCRYDAAGFVERVVIGAAYVP